MPVVALVWAGCRAAEPNSRDLVLVGLSWAPDAAAKAATGPFDDPVAVGGRGGVNGGVVGVHVAGGRGAAEGEGDGSDRAGGDHAPGEGCKGLEL